MGGRQVKVMGYVMGGEDGEGVRTKLSHPYSYDPITIWVGGGKAEDTVYTDRLFQWDHAKHDRLCEKHFGNRGQYWSEREPSKIEAFLRDYIGDPSVTLCCVTEYCNQATGYPVWRLDYRKGAPGSL